MPLTPESVKPAGPQLTLTYDAESQLVRLDFDPLQFRTWDFVIAALEMAKMEAERRKKFKEAEALMRQAEAQQQQAALAGRLIRPHH